MCGRHKTKKKWFIRGNDRGVALLIVLLVTALLIALIFEFAYATRISLTSAVNFRDSERAYYLARSGIFAFIKYGNQLRDSIRQGDWGTVPIISEGDTVVNIKWEDETGKIKITDVKNDLATKQMVRTLFEDIKGLDTNVFNKMTDQSSYVNKLVLLSGLHEYMSDEDFNKVSGFLTTAPVSSRMINVNTAPPEVLQSLGISADAVDLIVREREKAAYTDKRAIPGITDIKIGEVLISNYLTVDTSKIYTVTASARVGEYTKVIEAIVNGNSISYWRAL